MVLKSSMIIFCFMAFGILQISAVISSGSGSTRPRNSLPQVDLYPFGLESGDIELTLTDDSTFNVSFFFPFAGVYFETVYINTNGIISLGSGYTVFTPTDFPFSSQPLIAPFWIDLIIRNSGGTISYRFLNDTTAVDSAVNLYNNFSSPTYVSSGVLLVTWDQVELYDQSDTTGTFQVLLTTDRISSYVFYTYSDEIYPSGAVVGINVGDGINFDLQASLSLRNSETIAQGTNIELFARQGLYFYRLDNFSTPSTSTVSCVDGDFSFQQATTRTFISSEGFYVSNVSLLLTTCVGRIFGGVCRRRFDDVDAEVACRNLYFGLPVLEGEVAEDQFNNYTGPILIQDVECSGNESHPSECNVNTFITTECLNSSSIVRINCFFNMESVSITQGIPPKVYSNCPSKVSSLQEEVLQILSTDFGVSPLGLSRQYPAQSCDEIYDANPSSTSGFYWIRAESAIQLSFCTFNFI